jgi:hypothetical protein
MGPLVTAGAGHNFATYHRMYAEAAVGKPRMQDAHLDSYDQTCDPAKKSCEFRPAAITAETAQPV